MSAIRHIDPIKLGGIVSIRDSLLEQQASGKKIFRLESGDPSFEVSNSIKQAISIAMWNGNTHYTAGAGIIQLRNAIVNKLMKENNIDVSPSNILVTNGAMHALYITFRALCESQNDEFIIPRPTWTETKDNITISGGKPIEVPLLNYTKDTEEIVYNIKPWTRAIVINSPHNPTGTVLTRKQIEDIVEIAKEFNLWIISDEAYEHIIYDNVEHFSPGSIYDKTVSIYSFSKSYAMSGLRLGYLAIKNKDILNRMKKLIRCTINGVNSVTQHGGARALEMMGGGELIKEMVDIYTQRRNILYDALLKSSWFHPIKPDGAFYIWCKIDDNIFQDKDDWFISNHLADEFGIGSAPGSIFGAPRFIRFAFSCPTEQIVGASSILEKL